MKKAILIIGIVLAIILIVGIATDLLVYLALSILMALMVWIIGRTWGYSTKKAILTILAAAVILPMIIIVLVGMVKMQLNPEAINEISSNTIEQIINYFANNIVYIILADIAGVIAGAIISIFQGK